MSYYLTLSLIINGYTTLNTLFGRLAAYVVFRNQRQCKEQSFKKLKQQYSEANMLHTLRKYSCLFFKYYAMYQYILNLFVSAAKCVLAHNSLMELSRELSERDVRKLSHQLGVSEDLIDKFKDQMDGDIVRTNFQTLCEWRGKTGRATMVDFLISSLRTCGRSDCANIIGQVRSRQRGLTREDFNR